MYAYFLLMFIDLVLLVTVSVSISPTNPTGVPGVVFNLTCTTTIESGTGTPMFTWTGPVARGPVTGQISGNTYTDSYNLGRVRQSYEGTITCNVSLGGLSSTNSVSFSVCGKKRNLVFIVTFFYCSCFISSRNSC